MIPQKWDQPATFSGVAVMQISGQPRVCYTFSYVQFRGFDRTTQTTPRSAPDITPII